MFTDHVGKLLFPRLHPSQYGEKYKIIVATVLVGLVFGGILALVMILQGRVGK